ncbi:MAG TPA: glutamate-1-semialdehyde 2,1-aminomutase [Gemmata sp.]|nr:glutamate-1-semialdehyde 2,1-aminomutase [Gemmata sp.]
MPGRARSASAFARAKKAIPGGVNSPARAFGAVGGEPIFIARGEGPYLFDLDDNRYVDFIGSWGPMILGHCHPSVVEAAIAAIRNGSSFGAPCTLETELAELVVDAVPSMEMVRFVSSGTEATMSAIRLARGFTGRDIIIKFAGCYHGHVDALLVAAGSSALTHGVPNSPGIPRGCTDDTLVLNFNDTEALTEVFRERGDRIAAVILEPIVGNMGLVMPSIEFRRELRRLTRHHGALLIYDEVMTGFRVAYGGAQALLGDSPDITALGKIIGGGYPVGAFGGRAEIMNRIMPSGPVFQAGTLSGNPVAMAAGVATLKELKKTTPYERLEALGARLATALRAAARGAGVPVQVNRVGSMWTIFFTATPVTDFPTAKTSDTTRYSRFFWEMMDRGFYLPCSQFEAAFLSAPMTEKHIDQTAAAAAATLQSLGSR